MYSVAPQQCDAVAAHPRITIRAQLNHRLQTDGTHFPGIIATGAGVFTDCVPAQKPVFFPLPLLVPGSLGVSRAGLPQ